MDRRRLSGQLQREEREPGRVAGEGRGPAPAPRRGDRAGGKRFRAQRELASELAHRERAPREGVEGFRVLSFDFLKWVLVVALVAAAVPAFSAEKILASRVWPAQEYTRVTFESAKPIKHQSFSVPSPE